MKVRIAPAGFEFEAEPGLSLLESAEAAGIELPSSCRNGTCRTCLCHMPVGRVHYRIEWPGVSLDEKDEGWVLPCVAEPLADVTLDAPHAKSIF